MTCQECRGACCEELTVPAWWERLFPWVQTWLRVRGLDRQEQWPPAGTRLVYRCPQLTREGLCAAWKGRPLVCAAYVPGSKACQEVRNRRRPHDSP